MTLIYCGKGPFNYACPDYLDGCLREGYCKYKTTESPLNKTKETREK